MYLLFYLREGIPILIVGVVAIIIVLELLYFNFYSRFTHVKINKLCPLISKIYQNINDV